MTADPINVVPWEAAWLSVKDVKSCCECVGFINAIYTYAIRKAPAFDVSKCLAGHVFVIHAMILLYIHPRSEHTLKETS